LDYIQALAEAEPVLLKPGASISVPDHTVMACSQTWSHIPDYGPTQVLFDEIPGCIPWFGVFSPVHARILQFHYPQPVEEQEPIEIAYSADGIIPSASIAWTHGSAGLAERECFDVMVRWVIALENRRRAQQAILNTFRSGI